MTDRIMKVAGRHIRGSTHSTLLPENDTPAAAESMSKFTFFVYTCVVYDSRKTLKLTDATRQIVVGWLVQAVSHNIAVQ